MCELFGFSGRRNKILNPELAEFFTHSIDNPDGWGIAWQTGKDFLLEKEHLAAHNSEKLKQILEKEIKSRNLLAHIRRATIGYDEYHNSHPFTGLDASGRPWSLIHNGTIFEGDILSKYIYYQKGATDSERLFLCLIDEINNAIREKARTWTSRNVFW